MPKDRADLTDQYNTKLTPAEEQQYEAWAKQIGHQNDTRDYDLRGAWKAGVNNGDDPRGHFPDTYKKPNHPTFSVESQYSDGKTAGRWTTTQDGKDQFVAGAANLQFRTPEALQQYMSQTEPDVQLVLPTPRTDKYYGKPK